MMKWLFIVILTMLITQNVWSQQTAESTWLTEALKLQRDIDKDVPLKDATFLGTHNSYNSKAYQNLSGRYPDPNHTLSVTEQLNLGIRSIEYDAHWTLGDKFKKEILLCHGTELIGCSVFDRKIEEGFIELRDWLHDHPHEVVLLYIENFLDGQEQRLTTALQSYLGDFIYTPTLATPNRVSNTCMSMPADISKAQILNAGKQLLIVTKGCTNKSSNGNQNQSFADYVFTGIGGIPYFEDTFLDGKIGLFDERDCGNIIFSADKNHNSLWRVLEDRTFIGNISGKAKELTAEDMKPLLTCGVNWPTFDMLKPDDERLYAAVWSWAKLYPQPNAGNCAFYKKDEGIENADCDTFSAGFACKNSKTNAIKAISLYGKWNSGESFCQLSGSDWHYMVPVNGKEMAELTASMKSLLLPHVWLNYVYRDGMWVANK